MAEKIELGLSRNRLFDFNSTVVFKGRYKGELNESDVNKALKMLSVKEPVITAVACVEEDSKGYILTGKVNPVVSVSSGRADDIVRGYDRKPLSFYDRLFEFTISADGYLVIAGHTLVCDAKSLLRLAGYFADFYEKKTLSVEENEILTFSQKGSLPVDVISPLVNKLSSELDDGWQKSKKIFTLEDYKSACAHYFSEVFVPASDVSCFVENGDVLALCEKATELEVDFSSLLYFCFYKALVANVKVPKNESKLRVYADRRFFHGGKDIYSVGAYNGTVCVSLSHKEQRKSLEEQLKIFHLDIYRAITSPFRVFSDEILLMSVEDSFCDSSYMYMSGMLKGKAPKNLAKTYGCLNKELGDCFYCNLTQQYWESLGVYKDISVSEPMKERSRVLLNLVQTHEGVSVQLRYRDKGIDENISQKLIEDMVGYFDYFLK